ncbi:MAG: YhdH/YhfP family quinone oxidoreductase [Trueperaceae bacterium]
MSTFKAFRVEEKAGAYVREVKDVPFDTLPNNAVTIRVTYSALNYKDALSASGNPGVTKVYPHTPGIDAAGVVTDSRDTRFNVGDEVLVTSYDLGMNTAGGFAQYIRVPAEWVVLLPEGLTLREAMMLGTAGLTAAMCIEALEKNSLTSPVLVTGSSGGVGSVAVALLAKLGYDVIASTGSGESHDLLKKLGAKQIIERSEFSQVTEKPMLKPLYGGAVDTVGGDTLVNVVKSLQPGSSVAACGLVGGANLNLTIYPFILRNVNLLGMDSQNYPMAKRAALWQKLATDWKVNLEPLTTEIGLEGLDTTITQILQGKTKGHVLVKIA